MREAGRLDQRGGGAPEERRAVSPRAMSIRSATTALAVGPAPAPAPWNSSRPTKLPSATTALVTPVDRGSGWSSAATMQGWTRWNKPPPRCSSARPSSRMRKPSVAAGRDVGGVTRRMPSHVDAGEVDAACRTRARRGSRACARRRRRRCRSSGRPRHSRAACASASTSAKSRAARLHRREDVIAGAVEDAVDARRSRCAARPSRKPLITGMPPATAASNLSATPAASARLGELQPVMRDHRLVGGDEWLAARRARAATSASAGPSAPPISSTTHVDVRARGERGRVVVPA